MSYDTKAAAQQTAWITWLGSGLPTEENARLWRAECQRRADDKTQGKAERRLWQRRLKAANIVYNYINPKDNNYLRPRDFPAELGSELSLAACYSSIP